MRKTVLAMMATTALALTAGAASAQGWRSVGDREDTLEARIDAGVRSGDLTRAEATRLHADLDALERLEDRYEVGGFSAWERQDLDRRFDALSSRVRYERHDAQARDWFGGRDWTDNRGRWVPIEQRKAQLDRRIEQGFRSGQLTAAEATRLRAEFNAIARVEYRYQRNGLSGRERADLNRRFDQLAAQIRWERRDGDRQYGWNR